jgi:hypothetical protein
MVAAFEINSGDYFVAADMNEAVEKAEANSLSRIGKQLARGHRNR